MDASPHRSSSSSGRNDPSPHLPFPRASHNQGPKVVKVSRLSFQQWLLITFLLMAALFGASSFLGLTALEHLTTRSRETAENAVALNAQAQQLMDLGVTMERSSRQFVVLGDAGLRLSFENTSAHAAGVLDELVKQGAVPTALRAQWVQKLDAITALTNNVNPSINSTERQGALMVQFRDLNELHGDVTEAVRQSVEERNRLLQRDIAWRQVWLSRLMMGSFALAVILALTFGFWLAQPFKRLERAIVRLGENRLDEPIDIQGPGDVRRVGRQLDWLRVRLAEVDQDKARFLRHVSHELKTPLAALHEGVSLLEEGVAGELNGNQKEIARILQQNTTVLQGQIEDLLRFNAAAFEARQLRRKPTDLLQLLEDQADAQRLQWQARDIHVEVSGPHLNLEIDAEKIATVVANLLSNAIRFSPNGGHIRLTVLATPGKACVDVSDEGPGVAPNDRERIFEPFYRGSNQPADAARGSGIGLSIVQEYVAAHGGRVVLLPDHPGAHFRIEFPHADYA